MTDDQPPGYSFQLVLDRTMTPADEDAFDHSAEFADGRVSLLLSGGGHPTMPTILECDGIPAATQGEAIADVTARIGRINGLRVTRCLTPDPGNDPVFRDKIEAVLTDWGRRGIIQAGWSVAWDVGDGAYRTTMDVRSWHGTVRRYSFTEVELCQYVIGLVDLAPLTAGHRAVALAAASREERPA
jgi:hypothetical protein